VEPTIRPEPSADERAAILAAFQLLGDNRVPGAYRSGWREAGIRENVDEPPDAQLRSPSAFETNP
jgi:hypothetical protein